jgi:hypothetical protein
MDGALHVIPIREPTRLTSLTILPSVARPHAAAWCARIRAALLRPPDRRAQHSTQACLSFQRLICGKHAYLLGKQRLVTG